MKGGTQEVVLYKYNGKAIWVGKLCDVAKNLDF